MTTYLNHRQVASLIKAVGTKRTVLVRGPMGAGKTSILYEFMRDPAFANHHVLPPIDCTQLADGSLTLPMPDMERGVSLELPNERFGVGPKNQRGIPGSRPVVICFDEIAKGKQYVKDMIAPMLQERRLGNYFLPDDSIVFATTNLSEEGLGDFMGAHTLDRQIPVYMRNPTCQEWIADFAIPNKLAPEIIAAADRYPMIFDHFTDYLPGGKWAGKDIAKHNPRINNPADASQEKCVTPRALHSASDVIKEAKKHGLDDETLHAALIGAVGAVFASELTSFIRFGREMPAFERIVKDPAGTPIPGSPVAQIVCAFQCVNRTETRDEADAVTEYMQRTNAEVQSLFVNSVANSAAMARFATCARFGKMLAEVRKYFN